MRYHYQIRGENREILLERQGERYLAVVDGVSYEFSVLNTGPGELDLLFDGHPVRLHWAADGDKKWVALDGCSYLLEKPLPPARRRAGEQSGENVLRAPMPALVRAVLVEPGQAVAKGQPVMLLEAMKMEIRLAAPRAGVAAKVLAAVGETVQREQALIEFEAG
jgi:3-methylcrotonyl-CoA carboxylase alpha subunit